jgi:hypothetical protein
MLLGGCSSHAPRSAPGSAEDTENAGSAFLQLQLPGGGSLDSVNYVVTGPSAFSRSGAIDLRNSSTISATIGGLPAGAGYTITVTAAIDSGTVCAGSAPFDVIAHGVAMVVVKLTCHEPPRQGSASVNGVLNFCPVIDAVATDVSEVTLGHKIALTSSAHDSDAGPSALSYQWQTTAGKLSSATVANPTFTCTTVGTATLTLTVSDGDCSDTLTLGVTCSPPILPAIKINEIESSGGVPGDWAELYNAGSTTVDVSGWIFKDNDDAHSYAIPAGTNIAPGSYFLLEEAAFGFGLGSGDSARLYDETGIALVDSYTWTAHAATTYGRCPNGTGGFVTTASVTKGAANDCGVSDAGAAVDAGAESGTTEAGTAEAGSSDASDGAVTSIDPWPGSNAVVTVDGTNVFGTNLSDLSYQPAAASNPAVMWAIQNGPPTLYRLVFDGTIWTSSTDNGWNAGKALHYTNGLGAPDSEGVTKAELDLPGIYVATERDNNVSTVSRPAVLRFDTDAAGTSLTATHDWNLTSDLPVVGANLGLEAITFVPDTFLVANQFFDESTGSTYDPSHYLNHGTGIFLVGVEANGIVYAYAFDHVGGGFQRVATFSSGHAGVMSLQFDREVGNLWSYCDNTCGNRAGVLQIDTNPASPTRGRFKLRRIFDHPSSLPNSNNEGTAFAPESECVGGFKGFYFTDDDQLNGHAIRRDSIPCGSFF